MSDEKGREIPYGKPVRVGNFKLWRTKKTIGRGRERSDIEQVNVSTLDESWQVKIPATYEMVALLRSLFAECSEQRNSQLSSIFCNILYTSCVPNGYFQKAVSLCAMAYANPDLLRDGGKEHDDFVKSVRAVVDGFLEWRKAYDEEVARNAPTEEQTRSDEVADEIIRESVGE